MSDDFSMPPFPDERKKREPTEPSDTPIGEAPAPRARRRPGRPAKSETAKVPLDTLPPELLETAALAPLIISAAIAKRYTVIRAPDGSVAFEGVTLTYDAKAGAACTLAFKAWLASLNLELTPLSALLLCYTTAIVSAVPDAAAQYQMAQERIANKTTKAETPPPPPSQPSQPSPEVKTDDSGPSHKRGVGKHSASRV
jgi:hypothetical protein